MQRLEGKVAIVTGASQGIGQGIAKRLGCDGARVIVDYVGTPEGAEETQRAIEQCGSVGQIVQGDVTRPEDICKLVDTAWNQFGSSDILVNNAGMEKKSMFWDTPEEEYDKIMAVNLRGPFLMVKYAAPAMIARKYGKIISISSGTAYKGMPLMLHYITSKGGIVAFTRALSRGLGQHNICVNTLAPGLIETDGAHANSGRKAAARDRVVESRVSR